MKITFIHQNSAVEEGSVYEFPCGHAVSGHNLPAFGDIFCPHCGRKSEAMHTKQLVKMLFDGTIIR